jgi:hypothetical protein
MWEGLRALGLIKKEEREDIRLIETLEEIKFILESKRKTVKHKGEILKLNYDLDLLNSFTGYLRDELKKLKIEELIIKPVGPRGSTKLQIWRLVKGVKKPIIISKVKAAEKEVDIAKALLTALHDKQIESLLRAKRPELTTVYKMLLKFRDVHLKRRIIGEKANVKYVKQFLLKKIKTTFEEHPEETDLLSNLILAYSELTGSSVGYGIEDIGSGRFPEKPPYIFFLKINSYELKKVVRNPNKIKAYARLGFVLNNKGATIKATFLSKFLKHRGAHGI